MSDEVEWLRRKIVGLEELSGGWGCMGCCFSSIGVQGCYSMQCIKTT